MALRPIFLVLYSDALTQCLHSWFFFSFKQHGYVLLRHNFINVSLVSFSQPGPEVIKLFHAQLN